MKDSYDVVSDHALKVGMSPYADFLIEHIQALQSSLEELSQKVEELEKDAEMLDWLEQSGEGHAFCHTGYGEYRYYAHQQEGFNTVRETIGAAMQANSQ